MPAVDITPTDSVRYRFAPRESRGLLLGLRPRQVVLLGAAGVCLAAGAATGTAGLAAGALVAVLLAVACFVPVGGRSLEQWAPVAASWVWRGTAGRHWRVLNQPRESDGITLPPPLDAIALLSIETDEQQIALAVDRRCHTYTAVLALRGRTFALLEMSDRARRTDGWGWCLASLAREGSPIGRVQWCERTLPDDGSALRRWFTDHAALGATSLPSQSYADLIEDAAPVTQTHETYLAVQLDARRAVRAIRQAGGGDDGAAAVLLRELRTLETRLRSAELDLVGWLPPRGLARLIRTAHELHGRSLLARRDGDGANAGCSPAAGGPTATETTWAAYRTDDAWHATFWIAEWPRLEVDAEFLAPLLLRTNASRTVSVVMEPVSPRRAAREVQAARTAELADEALRERAGQIATVRRGVEHDALLARERELVAGHGDYRFTGYVTVTAATSEELEVACGEVEQAAHQSLLELRRLYGEQDTAFAACLPLCWNPR